MGCTMTGQTKRRILPQAGLAAALAGAVVLASTAGFGRALAARPATPVAAVKRLVRTDPPRPGPCYPNTSSPRTWYLPSSGCPLTRRLSHRLRSDPIRDVDPICRCQNVAPIRYSTVAHGATVYVTADWKFVYQD